ncbi:DUF2062 domain-containing protein [Ruixingdingia sedimenti]|uniref:DUF2062 domain-containing protein n=1 Tax=Ruixingdingia sedimenti TaxID=3073604 RepID=A0ABU1F9N1_9RHOB|nr:DUF2062 domain-containing protein [Xinfangfangia sp. LG-4]MDR5653124.1 DUF2062 domain-containing protein [Xinfangfangia sp. LG-4]
MVFKRRDARPWPRIAIEFFYPRGGWKRAAWYITYRLQRLPDSPERIARGIFAGVFISFTPFFGFHFIGAALIAFVIRGNILAALLATFAGNPMTTPIIAITAVELGHRMLGITTPLDVHVIVHAFSGAGKELWRNLLSPFTEDTAQWGNLGNFFRTIYLPYMVGGVLPGLAVSTVFYYGSLPLIRAYQRLRLRQKAERAERRLAARAAARAQAEAQDWEELTEGPMPPAPPTPDDPGVAGPEAPFAAPDPRNPADAAGRSG